MKSSWQIFPTCSLSDLDLSYWAKTRFSTSTHPEMWKYWMIALNIEMWYDRWRIFSCDLCQVWGDTRPFQAMPGLSPGPHNSHRKWEHSGPDSRHRGRSREELSVGQGLFYVSCPRQHWALREQWPDNTANVSHPEDVLSADFLLSLSAVWALFVTFCRHWHIRHQTS